MGVGLTHSFVFAAAFGMGLPPLAGRETVGLGGYLRCEGCFGSFWWHGTLWPVSQSGTSLAWKEHGPTPMV